MKEMTRLTAEPGNIVGGYFYDTFGNKQELSIMFKGGKTCKER
jgi:hypothetical protein